MRTVAAIGFATLLAASTAFAGTAGFDPEKPTFSFTCTGTGPTSGLAYDIYLKAPSIDASNDVHVEVREAIGTIQPTYSFPNANLLVLPAPPGAPYSRLLMLQAGGMSSAGGRPRFTSMTGVTFLEEPDQRGNRVILTPVSARLKYGELSRQTTLEYACTTNEAKPI